MTSIRRRSALRSPLAAALVPALVATAWAAPARAEGPRSETARARVERALSARETVPGPEALRRLDPNIEATLLDIVHNPGPRVFARTRAITLLQFFRSEATARVLRQVIDRARKVKRPGVELIDLQQAALAYAAVKGRAALPVLEPLLAHPNIDVRSTSVRAVRLTGSPRALGVLTARRAVEPSSTVTAHIEKQIRQILVPTQGPSDPALHK